MHGARCNIRGRAECCCRCCCCCSSDISIWKIQWEWTQWVHRDGAGSVPLSLMRGVEHHHSQRGARSRRVAFAISICTYNSAASQTLFYTSCTGICNHSLHPIKSRVRQVLRTHHSFTKSEQDTWTIRNRFYVQYIWIYMYKYIHMNTYIHIYMYRLHMHSHAYINTYFVSY